MLTNVLGPGPAVVATRWVPDLDHFRGSFGARGVIPLWHDVGAQEPNVEPAWLAWLSERYALQVGPEALLAYAYAVLSCRGYVDRFAEELRTPGPRVPMTSDAALFRRAVELGDEVLAIHTYTRLRAGAARVVSPIEPVWPHRFGFDASRKSITIGSGRIAPVAAEVWDYAVSGYRVIAGWLRRRLTVHTKSPLDAVTPERWTAAVTRELLEVIWLVEATLALEPVQDALLAEIVSGGCLQAVHFGSAEKVEHRIGLQRPREDEALPLVTAELVQAVPL
jgi:hypothetical protein